MPSRVTEQSDAYGEMLLAALGRDAPVEIVERDDGFIDAGRFGAAGYLAPFRSWPAHHRRAMRYARGRVLDVGCGGGRVALHLQERDQDVVGIDISPGAIEACRRRGVRDARLLSIDEIDESLGLFDTIVMLGNNFGLFASARKAKRLLRRFHRLTTAHGRIIAETRDVHRTDDPAHLRYQARNRARGRMAGQIRIRVRLPRPRDAVVRLPDGLAERAGATPRRHGLGDRPHARLRRHVRRRHRQRVLTPLKPALLGCRGCVEGARLPKTARVRPPPHASKEMRGGSRHIGSRPGFRRATAPAASGPPGNQFSEYRVGPAA